MFRLKKMSGGLVKERKRRVNGRSSIDGIVGSLVHGEFKMQARAHACLCTLNMHVQWSV